jgi:hypothetical protein
VTFTGGRFFGPEFRRGIFAGAAAADVASVELVLTNGETVPTHVVERPLGPDVPLNVYWTELGPDQGLESCLFRDRDNGQLLGASGAFVEEVVARDSEGNVLGGRVAAWNANPTGDPEGRRPRVPLEPDPCVR